MMFWKKKTNISAIIYVTSLVEKQKERCYRNNRSIKEYIHPISGNHEINCKAEYDSSSSHVEDDQWEDLANGSGDGDEQGQIDVEAFNSGDEDEMEEGQPFIKRAKMEFVQPGNNVFYNDARHVDHLMIFGMK